MNKRIRILLDQCDESWEDNDGNMVVSYDAKKFADLIIQECADQLDIEYGNSTLTGIEAGLLLKKRFGVE